MCYECVYVGVGSWPSKEWDGGTRRHSGSTRRNGLGGVSQNGTWSLVSPHLIHIDASMHVCVCIMWESTKCIWPPTLNESSVMWHFKCGHVIGKHNRIFSFYTGLLPHINIACTICIVLTIYCCSFMGIYSNSVVCLRLLSLHLCLLFLTVYLLWPTISSLFLSPLFYQVREAWQTYELELINYQNKCKIIRGWDDLFTKVKEHINSVTAMKLSPYFKVSEQDISCCTVTKLRLEYLTEWFVKSVKKILEPNWEYSKSV